jgi:hypothetical protein
MPCYKIENHPTDNIHVQGVFMELTEAVQRLQNFRASGKFRGCQYCGSQENVRALGFTSIPTASKSHRAAFSGGIVALSIVCDDCGYLMQFVVETPK